MRKLWNAWKNIAEKIGSFQTTVIFSLLYFLLITPLGFIVSIFRDFLHTKDMPSWLSMEDSVSTFKKIKSQ